MDPRLLRADELGIRLEIVGGLPIWEPSPVYRHQKAVDRIRATITPGEVAPPMAPASMSPASTSASRMAH